MNITKPKLPGAGFGAGHTGQYITLAEALRQSVEAMEEDLVYLNQRGLTVSAALLRMEARAVTVTLLAAAICESAANTILASALSAAAFDAIEFESTVRKWTRRIPDALPCPPPPPPAEAQLRQLFDVRNAIMHAKATVFADGETVKHAGNSAQWVHLNPETSRHFARVPLQLTDIIPVTADLMIRSIGISLRERQPRLPLPNP